MVEIKLMWKAVIFKPLVSLIKFSRIVADNYKVKQKIILAIFSNLKFQLQIPFPTKNKWYKEMQMPPVQIKK